MTESKKRDFISQMIELILNNQGRLTEAGFDPSTKLETLQTKSGTAKADEAKQQEAKAALKEATATSVASLKDAYSLASNFADLISGLYGKDDPMVQEIRKMRK